MSPQNDNQSPNRQTRIAVLSDTDFAQAAALLQGITHYSEQHGLHWDILPLHFSQEQILPELTRTASIDGLIGAFASNRWITSLPNSATLPIINTSNISTISVVPSVIPDDTEIGSMAAEHLLERSFSTFAFGGLRSCTYSHERQAGFTRKLDQHGFKVTQLPDTDISKPLYSWLEAIRRLPQPVAVLCANDFIARRLTMDATANGLPVPRAVAIVGVGNSALDSFFAEIGITSVVLPTQAIGHRAADLMAKALLDHQKPKPQRIIIPPAGIITRASTGMGPMHPLVARALTLINEQIGQTELTVASLVSQLNASRRLVEIRFRDTLGHSPHTEITRQRMALARRLLLDPRIRIADIAIRCGYTEVSHFYHRFKTAHKTTPAAWRKNVTQ